MLTDSDHRCQRWTGDGCGGAVARCRRHAAFAAYAIKAARAAAASADAERASRRECCWQRDRLPDEIGDLVLGLAWPVAHIANIGWLAVVVNILLVVGIVPLAFKAIAVPRSPA